MVEMNWTSSRKPADGVIPQVPLIDDEILSTGVLNDRQGVGSIVFVIYFWHFYHLLSASSAFICFDIIAELVAIMCCNAWHCFFAQDQSVKHKR